MENSSSVANFDLSSECPNYFKSTFARTMAFTSGSQSKSLDYVYMDEGSTISEEGEAEMPLKPNDLIQRKPPFTPRRSVPTIPTYELQREFSLRSSRARSNDAIKFWKMKQESLKTTPGDGIAVWSESRDQPEDGKEEEVVRLRKECQGLMEANRKLQQSTVNIDHGILQAQIDTLQWQLKQAESSRQMYRAVMEQVSKFLDRVHKSLESANQKSQGSRSKARVPRSRSVHTVAQSRASSPSASVHRANSISQIQDSYCAFRDYACRASRAVLVEEAAPERLSQEAFRLLRTVQSLLGTREPDLARVSGSDTETNERRDSTSMGSCSSLLQSSSSRDVEEMKGGGGPATPQLSVGSTEDESGFSSMSSFHEVGLPPGGEGPPPSGGAMTTGGGSSTSGGSFHELGLPVIESGPGSSSGSNNPNRHRRWSSTPVDHPTTYPQREALRVLWCSSRTQEGLANFPSKTGNTIRITRTAYSNDGFNDRV